MKKAQNKIQGFYYNVSYSLSWHNISKMQHFPASARCSQGAQVAGKNGHTCVSPNDTSLKDCVIKQGLLVIISLNSPILCVVGSRVKTTALFLN